MATRVALVLAALAVAVEVVSLVRTAPQSATPASTVVTVATVVLAAMVEPAQLVVRQVASSARPVPIPTVATVATVALPVLVGTAVPERTGSPAHS